MRKYSSNLAFIDLLFNLLVGFTSLFVIAFLLINPIAKKGVVDPPILMMVEIEWDDYSYEDIDLYVKGPDGKTVFYSNKNNGYIVLKRDDLGMRNDSFYVNGVLTEVRRNYEVTTMTVLPDGDYVVNIHYFSGGDRTDVRVRVTGIQPFQVYYEGEVNVSTHQEVTVLVFKIADGKIKDIRTDVDVKLRLGRRPSL